MSHRVQLNMNRATDLLQWLSKRLGVAYCSQDWGIANAEPSRLLEFIEFYERESLDDTLKYQLMELIIASANEALIDGSLLSSTLGPFEEFIGKHRQDAPTQMEYWSGLPNTDEYPVGVVLRRVLR